MALEKNYTSKGFTSNYWMVGSFSPNKINNTTSVTLFLYKDKETRTANATNYFKTITLRLSDYLTVVSDIYDALKETNTSFDEINDQEEAVPFFSDASDV